MAIYSYRMACGQTRWMFVIDLPPAADGKRRQMCRKGFRSQDAALVAETKARQAYGARTCPPTAALPPSWRTGSPDASWTCSRPP